VGGLGMFGTGIFGHANWGMKWALCLLNFTVVVLFTLSSKILVFLLGISGFGWFWSFFFKKPFDKR
ncbi:hypothetical protein ACQWFT_25945, partial [Salmonella enterica subsp. enterica serovar Infantis]